jgi:hypothetical protein
MLNIEVLLVFRDYTAVIITVEVSSEDADIMASRLAVAKAKEMGVILEGNPVESINHLGNVERLT